MKLRYKIGDTVKVNNINLHAYGAIGKIKDIDRDWNPPYEVDFGRDKYNEELFYESDLILANEEDVEEPSTTNPRDFIDIAFQNVTVKDYVVNGEQMEDVIDVLIERLIGFQRGDFPCRENALAITKLEEARMWLNERTRKRVEQGVEGEDKNHGL